MKFAGVLLFLSVAILAISAKPIKTGKTFRIPFTVVDHNTTLGLRRRNTARIPLTSFKEKIWKGTVGFGTPQQQLTVIFDTGSSDSWVADADCENCENLPTYNMGNSGTGEDTGEEFECQYSDGDEIKGTWTRDTVTLQDVPFEEQAFVRATQVPESIKTNGYSGLIGLGFTALCDNEDMTPLIQTLEETAELDSGLISCRFVKDNTEQAGELLFGAVENQYVDGNIVYIPLVRSFNQVTDWAVRVVGLASQGKSMPQQRIPTIVDTGGSTINVTPDVASWLYSGITGAKLVDSTWYIPDPFPSDVTFDFEQAKFSVPAADMLLREEPKNGDLYAAAIQGYAGEKWVVGQPFIKNHYVVFNYGARTLGIGKRRDP